jgi:hypothetical protein
MAGLRGNQAWLLAQKQTVKGTAAVPALTSAYKMPFTGGNIAPTRETDRLTETDASRDAGQTYIASSGVEGTPEFYVRDAAAAFWLYAVLGAVATTGAGPNYTHTLTPANTLPYITVWRDLSDTLYEEFRDCKVGSLSVSAEAGAPLTMSAGIQGLQATRLTAAPDTATPVPLQSGTVYNYNDATVTLGGGATALVRSFDLSIENNLSRQQTDNVVPYDVVEGMREVSLGFDLIFETLDEYNKFHYGGAAGTSIASTVYQTDALFTFSLGANNSIAFNLPRIVYEEFDVAPDPGGDPIVVPVRAVAQRGGTPILTATVKNQVVSY